MSGGQRSVLVAAVSRTGASWDRVGAILEPEPGEVAVSHPRVLDISRTFFMFYASDVGGPIRTALATSSVASRRVAERVGFTFDREVLLDRERLPMHSLRAGSTPTR